MRYECVIFDFDGTLADSENSILYVYNVLAKKHGSKTLTREDMNWIKNSSIPEIVDRLNLTYSKGLGMIARGKKILKNYMHTIKPYDPDLKLVLETLEEYTKVMGVVSSNSKKNIRQFLKTLEINTMDFVISSHMFGKSNKVKKIIKKYKLLPEQVLYVGDEIRDIEASRESGIDICSVTWGYNTKEVLKENQPDYVIDNLYELLDIIENHE